MLCFASQISQIPHRHMYQIGAGCSWFESTMWHVITLGDWKSPTVWLELKWTGNNLTVTFTDTSSKSPYHKETTNFVKGFTIGTMMWRAAWCIKTIAEIFLAFYFILMATAINDLLYKRLKQMPAGLGGDVCTIVEWIKLVRWRKKLNYWV